MPLRDTIVTAAALLVLGCVTPSGWTTGVPVANGNAGGAQAPAQANGGSAAPINAKPGKGNEAVPLVATATGSGDSLNSAQAAALIAAVRSVTGATVVTTTELKNDRVTKDEEILYSSGNVRSYELLDSYVGPDGLTYAHVRAVVEPSAKIKTVYGTQLNPSQAVAGTTLAAQYLVAREELIQRDRLLAHVFGGVVENGFVTAANDLTVTASRDTDPPIALDFTISLYPPYVESVAQALASVCKPVPVRTRESGDKVALAAPSGNSVCMVNDRDTMNIISDALSTSALVEVRFTDAAGHVIMQRSYDGSGIQQEFYRSRWQQFAWSLDATRVVSVRINDRIPLETLERLSSVTVQFTRAADQPRPATSAPKGSKKTVKAAASRSPRRDGSVAGPSIVVVDSYSTVSRGKSGYLASLNSSGGGDSQFFAPSNGNTLALVVPSSPGGSALWVGAPVARATFARADASSATASSQSVAKSGGGLFGIKGFAPVPVGSSAPGRPATGGSATGVPTTSGRTGAPPSPRAPNTAVSGKAPSHAVPSAPAAPAKSASPVAPVKTSK